LNVESCHSAEPLEWHIQFKLATLTCRAVHIGFQISAVPCQPFAPPQTYKVHVLILHLAISQPQFQFMSLLHLCSKDLSYLICVCYGWKVTFCIGRHFKTSSLIFLCYAIANAHPILTRFWHRVSHLFTCV